jgi:hypothetical protein
MTTRVTITIDEGTLHDATDAASEHGMSVSAWITRCTERETRRDALARHQQWCAAEGLSGDSYGQHRSQLIADAAAELDRRSEGHRGTDAA